jgi:CubicO group peptidase (beta-lactamase class C family)
MRIVFRIHSLKIAFLLIVLVTAACQPIVAPTSVDAPATEAGLDAETMAALEEVIEQGMAEYQVPGLAIGIVKDGMLVYAQGFGVTELGKDQPVTPQSVFLLSSIAKTATSTAVMQLVEQGKIELDAPVTDYLPYFALADERYRAITIRQLLSHTAGLPEYDYSTYGQDAQVDDGALERYVRSLSTIELLSAPGETWEYSGIGFDILGDIVAKVSGQSFEAYVSEHIFQPLGMEDTTLLLAEVEPALLATPHIPDATGAIAVNDVFPYDRIHAPDSALFSTIEDMARYAMAHLNQGELEGARILSAASYDELWKSHGETWFPPDLERNYGLGWAIGRYREHLIIGHGGADVGFNTFLALLPEESMAVIMFTNYSTFGLGDPAEWILPAFFIREPVLDTLLGVKE